MNPRSVAVIITLSALAFLGSAFATPANAAEVFTDKLDYPPGDNVIITGIDFNTSETVTVRITHLDGGTPATSDYDPWDVIANSFGNFETIWVVPEDAVGETLLVTATGLTSGLIATTTFTDATTLLYLTYDNPICTSATSTVCAILLEKCTGSTTTPLPNRPILFFIAEGNCGVDVGQAALDTVYTDANGEACSNLPFPDSAGLYSIRAKFLGEAVPGHSDPPNSACDPEARRQLSASNACEEVTISPSACNQPPVATCPGDTSIFLCTLGEVCIDGFLCTDPDGNLESCDVSLGTLSGGSVCFTPTGAGVYTITLVATDSAGAADTCQTNVTITLNADPVCNLPANGAYFVCGDTTFTFPVSATDSDGNLTGCSMTSGPGTFDGSNWIFTTTGAGVYSATFECADDCGATCGGTVSITVNYNAAPVAVCPGDTTIFVCDLSPLTLSGFTCTDVDANLTTCAVDNGTLSGDQVTFTPVPGVNTIALTATDVCGATDNCQTSVTVVVNTAPVATCPGDTSIFVCDLSPITLSGFTCTDVDANLATCAVDNGTLSGDQVTFTPVAGVNTITLTATDACGATDNCQTTVTITVNSPPVCNFPPSQTFFVSGDTTLTFPISATDPDGNLVGCTKTSGDGTFDGSTWTITTTGPGTYTATFECEDACGEICGGEASGGVISMVITYNRPPVASCPGNQSLFVCDLSPITIGTFSCIDPDDNLLSCTVDNGTLTGDQVIFTPVVGVNTITLIALDDAGAADTCQTQITITLNSDPVASCPGDTTIFVCDLSPLTLPGFVCSDVDGNLASCNATGGTLSGDQITFTPIVGVNTITLTATDSCEATDNCQTIVTIVLNTPPVATCPGDTTIFVCDLAPLTLSGFSCYDSDDNLTSCDASTGTYSGGQVTFTPVAGANTITLTATDACSATDDCQTNVTIILNGPPVANCPGDTAVTFTCEASEICYGSGFTSSDPDNNIVSETVSHGTLNAGAVCFTPDTAGVYSIIYTVTDACDEVDACTSLVTVSYVNEAPVASCHGDTTIFVCDLSPITLSGFTCTDVDDNLTSCAVDIGTLTGDQVTFTPVAGANIISLTATDACGLTDDCQTTVTVVLNQLPYVNVEVPEDDSVFLNTAIELCYTVGYGDPDYPQYQGEPVAELISGLGTLVDHQLCFTPIDGVDTCYWFIIQVYDSCCAGPGYPTAEPSLDTSVVDSFCVTVTFNDSPLTDCPPPIDTFVCELTPITVCGFDCADPDDNLVSCETNYGPLASGCITFTPSGGENYIILTATDAGGMTDICSTLVAVTLNSPPIVSCPGDTAVTFTCEPSEICYGSGFTSSDPDDNIVSETVSLGTLVAGAVCFTPDTAGVYSIIFTATDACDEIDVCTTLITVSYVNSPPVAECPPAIDTFMCAIAPITVSGFTCSDPDYNLLSCETVPGPLTGGSVTFTPVEGVNYIVLTATDECGETDICTTQVNVTLNQGPDVECPANITYTLCDLEQICVSGFVCTDPNDNLLSCEVVGHTLDNGTVCFTPVEGENDLMLVATDACGIIDSCHTIVTVNLIPGPSIEDVTVNTSLCAAGDVCVDLPTVTGGAAPFTWTFDGDLVTDAICFNFADDDSASGQLMVTDSCGRSATATVSVTATVNTPPVATIDITNSIFACEPGFGVKFLMTIVDPDNGLTVTANLGNFDGADSSMNYVINTAGEYCDVVIVADSCGLADTLSYCFTVTFNSDPECPFIEDQLFTQCDPEGVVIPVFATDVDDNLVDCVVSQGPGEMIDGMWHYTPSGDETVAVTITCIDFCGAFCETSFTVEFDINDGPIPSCPDNMFRAMFALTEICVGGFSCDDPDDNLVSCRVIYNEAEIPLVGDEVCFTPDWGDNDIYLIAEDACGEADTCMTTVMVTELSSCPIVVIEKTHGTIQGHYEEVSLTYQSDPVAGIPEIGGFDFLIAYDASALTFTEAEPGQLLEDCGWEYFTYRYGVDGNCGDACPSGLLRIIAIAETNNGPNHPLCYGPPDADPHQLATLTFFVTNDRTFECQYTPIRFFWADCSDNAVSSIDGDSLIIDSKIYDFEGNLIWEEDDDDQFPEDERIPFVGAPDFCLEGDKVTPFRCLELYSGGIDIVCADSIDARGDINVNGVPNEVADAVMLTNYFLNGLSAFGSHVESSIAASDVNADGVALSVADLVYLVRVISGDAPPYTKQIPNNNFDVTTSMDDHNLTINYSSAAEAGAVLMVFDVDGFIGIPTVGNGAEGMDVSYNLSDNQLRVLVYNIGENSIASGNNALAMIPVDGRITLVEMEVADYHGRVMNVNIQNLPDRFELRQNYPNPFNPTTTIEFSLSAESDWTLTVYDILGQVVDRWNGHDQPGAIRVDWDASDKVSGIYFYRVEAGIYNQSKKMMLLK